MNCLPRRALAPFAIVLAAIASQPAHAQRDPVAPRTISGTLTIRAHAADIGVGYTWGDGTLRYHGHTYKFDVKGVNVAAVGYSTIAGHGRVYHLTKLLDFTGTYASSTGEATLDRGLGGQILVNGAGVQIRLDTITRGARLSGSADGIQLTLK